MTAKNLKVGLITFNSFLRPGGIKSHIFGLYNQFKKEGIPVKIIAPRRSSKENYGKDIILLGTSFPISASGSESDFAVSFNPLAINKVLKKEKFDVLHFHNFGSPSSFQILDRSHSLNVLTFHANIEGSKFFNKFPSVLRFLRRLAQNKVDGLIVVAPFLLEFFKDFSGPKVVIPNGINLEEFSSEKPKIKKFNDGKINILFVGRIEERKGLIYLLKAYKNLSLRSRTLFLADARNKILSEDFSNLRLIIVGEGKLKGDCQKWAKSNELEEIYFEGEKKAYELPSCYTTCDIFVSPAIFGESFGIVLLEAMASGKPIVAFANKGYKQFMEGKRGEKFLAKPHDYKDLAKKIEILIKNEKLRKEMGEWGFKEAKKYSWSIIGNKVLDFYQLCIENRQRHTSKKKRFNFDKIFEKIYNKSA